MKKMVILAIGLLMVGNIIICAGSRPSYSDDSIVFGCKNGTWGLGDDGCRKAWSFSNEWRQPLSRFLVDSQNEGGMLYRIAVENSFKQFGFVQRCYDIGKDDPNMPADLPNGDTCFITGHCKLISTTNRTDSYKGHKIGICLKNYTGCPFLNQTYDPKTKSCMPECSAEKMDGHCLVTPCPSDMTFDKDKGLCVKQPCPSNMTFDKDKGCVCFTGKTFDKAKGCI